MQQIILKQSHTHGGVSYAAGDTIEVVQSIAQWLVEHGVGEYGVRVVEPVVEAVKEPTKEEAPTNLKLNRTKS